MTDDPEGLAIGMTFEDLEVIRIEAGMPTSGFCDTFGVPERSWQALARTGARPAKGPWPARRVTPSGTG